MNPEFPASSRGPAWKWWVCGLLLLATMLNYMDRLTLNLTSALVMRSFSLDASDYGQLESAFAFAFALGSITFGWLADRINVRWLYPLALLAWSAAGFATGLVESFAMLLACRFCLGLFEGSNWPCALWWVPWSRTIVRGLCRSSRREAPLPAGCCRWIPRGGWCSWPSAASA
jgi:MFS family permease